MKKGIILGSTIARAAVGVIGYKVGQEHNEKIREAMCRNNRILILVNHEVVIYNFRLELVERLLSDGYEVHISTPGGERVDKLKDLGCIIHDISFDRHGVNPFEELRLLKYYRILMRKIQPLIVFSYTIKPNIYGAIASRTNHIPFVANITGLGTAVENSGLQSKVMIGMYRLAFGGRHGKIQRVFFQNNENEQVFRDNGIALDVHGLLPGSGVNTERFPYREYPEDGVIKFAFISRIMKEKGIDHYLDAAEKIRSKYGNKVEFHVCGFCEPEYDGRLQEEDKKGIVKYHGMIQNVTGFMGDVHCIIHPTYYPEGISNVLLEACATGRPIITTDRSGCKEVVDDGINGFMVECQSSEKLIEAVEKFLSLSWEQKKAMGVEARHKVEREFDRQIVVNAYIDDIKTIKSAGIKRKEWRDRDL